MLVSIQYAKERNGACDNFTYNEVTYRTAVIANGRPGFESLRAAGLVPASPTPTSVPTPESIVEPELLSPADLLTAQTELYLDCLSDKETFFEVLGDSYYVYVDSPWIDGEYATVDLDGDNILELLVNCSSAVGEGVSAVFSIHMGSEWTVYPFGACGSDNYCSIQADTVAHRAVFEGGSRGYICAYGIEVPGGRIPSWTDEEELYAASGFAGNATPVNTFRLEWYN